MSDERDRPVLCVGLLLAVAGVSEIRRTAGVRSVCRVVHHTLYRRQYAVHGSGSPRYG